MRKFSADKKKKTDYGIKTKQDRKTGYNVQHEAATRTENTESTEQLFVAL